MPSSQVSPAHRRYPGRLSDCLLWIVGMVATAARTILESIDRIPNADQRTKVGIIAVSTALHFFSLPVSFSSDNPVPESQLRVDAFVAGRNRTLHACRFGP